MEFKNKQKRDLIDCHVSLGNDLLLAVHNLTLSEKKVVWLMLSKLNSKEKLEPDHISVLKAEEYADMLGIKPSDAFYMLERVADTLLSKKVTLAAGDKVYKFHWIDWICIDKDVREISVTWNKEIRARISELGADNPFTKIFNIDYVRLNSKHSLRLYEIIASMRHFGKEGFLYLDIETIKNLFELTSSYDNFATLTAKVLEPAIAELKDRSIVKLTMNPCKKVGKKITRLRFDFVFY